MLLQDFRPAPDLQEIVQLYRIVHFRFDRGQDIPSKAYPPRPEHCLAFYPFDTETVEHWHSGKIIKDIPVVLYGQYAEVTNRKIGANFLVFQIIFNPGALFRLTGIPTQYFNDTYQDATCVFSNQLKFVNEQLHHAKDYPAMLEVANKFVRKLTRHQKKQRLPIDDACEMFQRQKHKYTIELLARDSCLSFRQLDRLFKERTGVNPKMYQRIIRFDKAFRLKNSKPDLDWLSIALSCDYYDHQHLSKEYKTFTGLSPSEFHLIENKAPERVFGLNEGYYEA